MRSTTDGTDITNVVEAFVPNAYVGARRGEHRYTKANPLPAQRTQR